MAQGRTRRFQVRDGGVNLSIMNIVVMGAGYCGLVTAADFAARGSFVTCVDIDGEKIAGLEKGEIPFFEPGLAELVHQQVQASRLSFSADAITALGKADIVFSAVGTPPNADGSANTDAVLAVADTVAEHAPEQCILVNKSTVPVGTAKLCKDRIVKKGKTITVASNPEFLSQGSAVKDAVRPSRIVIGANDDRARALLREVYKAAIDVGIPYLEMSIESAEAVKMASNAFLATKIAFVNEVGNYCQAVGANVVDVTKAMGLDPRIGPHYMKTGLGFGGGCLPKDVAALVAEGDRVGESFEVLQAVQTSNMEQRLRVVEEYRKLVGSLAGKRVAVWGLAFKPNTDDVRGSPAIDIIRRLVDEGATVVAHDPQAMQNAKERIPGLTLAADPLLALDGADALFVLTSWDEYRAIDTSMIEARLKEPIIIDPWNVFGG